MVICTATNDLPTLNKFASIISKQTVSGGHIMVTASALEFQDLAG